MGNVSKYRDQPVGKAAFKGAKCMVVEHKTPRKRRCVVVLEAVEMTTILGPEAPNSAAEVTGVVPRTWLGCYSAGHVSKYLPPTRR